MLDDRLRKAGRAQARLSLRLDEIERKLEAGFDDLRSQVQGQSSAVASEATASPPKLEGVLDAMDSLDEAILGSPSPDVRRGLQSVLHKLDSYVTTQGMERHADRGVPPDGKLFRIVGGEAASSGVAEGCVLRVVRAAVTYGDSVLREGEVVVRRTGP
ncbi:MAG: nucleotide exchange factor GrpE [Nannocystaceae bacterium]